MCARRFASVFILSAICSAGTVYAADESFTVSRIVVDKTAPTATEARSLGLAEGQILAWRKLIERIAMGGDVARLLAFSDKEIAPLLEGFEVERETSSPVRYLGTLTYRFRPAAVRGLLRQAHSEEVRGAPKPMALLPLFREGDKAVLWEGENPWRRMVSGRSWNSGLVPLVVPVGDEADAAVVDEVSAYEATPLKLDPLLRRYDAFDGVVAEFVAATDGGSLTLRRSGQAIFSERFTKTVGEGQESYFDRVITGMLAALEDQWRKDRIAQAVSVQAPLTARVPLRSLGDWIEVKKRLEAVPGVRAARLKSLSIAEAIVELPFTVPLEQATKNLAQRELQLTRGEEGYELRFTGGVFFGAQVAPKTP